MRFVSYGNKIVLGFLRLCPTTQSLSLPDTSPDAIRRATVGRFVAILVFSFVPFMLFSSAGFVLYLEVPRWLLSTSIFPHLFYFFIYLPWHLKLASILKAKLQRYVI